MKRLYFLPGMMCDERLFSSQVDALASFCHCVVLPFDQGDSMAEYANTVITRVKQDAEASGEAPSAVLAGLSMGGIVAMECLRIAPELFVGVILMDTNPLAEVPSRRALRQPQIQRVLEGELDTVLIDEMKPLYLAPVNQDDTQILSLVLDMARNLGAEVFAQQSRAIMHRRDNSEALAGFNRPALVLHGEDDQLCPPERHQLMHELLPQSTLVTIPNAGHLPTLEAPEAVNVALCEFVTQCFEL